MATKLYDVLIIGGGPAGLTLATSLARQVYSALILDSGAYRNAVSKHMHTVPGFDHVDPADFRAKVRADLAARYDCIEYKSATIAEVRKLESGVFEAVDEQGVVYQGKKLGLGTGVRDMLEKMPEGYESCWGKGIFHCLFCHGYEERGADSAGVFGGGIVENADMLSHASLMAKRLAKGLTIYTDGKTNLIEEVKAKLHSSKIRYDDRKIVKFELQNGGPAVTITFADGSTATEGFIASHPTVEQRAPFLEKLGLEMTPSGEIKVNPPFNSTSVPGCYAAGDAATPLRNAIQAINMGGFAGAGLVFELARELDAADEL